MKDLLFGTKELNLIPIETPLKIAGTRSAQYLNVEGKRNKNDSYEF